MTLQEIMGQLGSLFQSGGGQAPLQGTMTMPDAYNTSNQWTPGGTPGAVTPDSGFGLNLGTAGAAIGGLNALGSFLQGNQALKLGKDQFKFQKELANTNLNNSIKSYNTALEDRLTARGAVQGDDPTLTQEKIDRNRLTR